jgi:hypothetical protein
VYYWAWGRDQRCVWSLRLGSTLMFGGEEMTVEKDERAGDDM